MYIIIHMNIYYIVCLFIVTTYRSYKYHQLNLSFEFSLCLCQRHFSSSCLGHYAKARQGPQTPIWHSSILLELTGVFKLKGSTSERVKRSVRQPVHWWPTARARTWLFWESWDEGTRNLAPLKCHYKSSRKHCQHLARFPLLHPKEYRRSGREVLYKEE